ncbi:MAG: hypothetical protein AAF518_13450 [Spirochaetota bacterium]
MESSSNEHLLELYSALPKEIQNIVHDFIQLMHSKYVQNEAENSFGILSTDEREELLQRVRDYDKNPEDSYSSEQMEEIFHKDYGL